MIDYNKAIAAARRRAQAIRNNAAEQYALARSPIKYEPSESAKACLVTANHNLSLRLCPHGKVPRLIAERMAMPRLACAKCA